MKTHTFSLLARLGTLMLALSVCYSVCAAPIEDGDNRTQTGANGRPVPAKTKTAIVAGGCFWCVETDFENAPGVVNVISGYSGGRSKNPTYKTYKTGGHREVALVEYDPTQINYAGIVEWLVKHIDPTNGRGQFNDIGKQYSPAIYYQSAEEKTEAERVLKAIEEMRVYKSPLRVDVEERAQFWPAEEYHQDYHHKNHIKYTFFRLQSGRDRFVASHWGPRANVLELPGAQPESAEKGTSDESQSLYKQWVNYEKPSQAELRQKLSPIQYRVTQQDGTETAGSNPYNKNKRAGIYVDIVSGAPLFSSSTKFDSGTGWPSFTQPIDPAAVMTKIDNKNVFLGPRIEVRSRFGDNHLGHVFNDGPANRGGKRFCMNSAAMRFIPKADMEKEGYGDFLKFVK
ncbi:MAG: peptide-methionine (R)-S-oxide reductase MsrB [Aureliella sp.]